ncbi:MAG: hypothetical protein NXH82_09755 [Rhodobacteraceae bacterium]|nr:hypothetical protein [Paracoccaceae bacterium]
MSRVDIIDINALFARPSPERDACDAALWSGLRRTGAVCLTGYPDSGAIDTLARTGLRFFDMPEPEKRKLASWHSVPGNPNLYRGYHPHDPESDFRTDFLDIGPDAPAPGPDLPGMDLVTQPTPWPETEPVPGWREAVRRYYGLLERVGKAVMPALGRSAGFDDTALMARFDGQHSTLRFLDYPASGRTPGDTPTVQAACHTDASGLSLLWQGGPGLQARAPDGTFLDVPVLDNCISLHVGTVMQTLTDGRVPATPHRVVDLGVRRQSVGFFLEPALSAAVTPLHDTAGPTPVADTYAWQLLTQLSGYGDYGRNFPNPDTRPV